MRAPTYAAAVDDSPASRHSAWMRLEAYDELGRNPFVSNTPFVQHSFNYPAREVPIPLSLVTNVVHGNLLFLWYDSSERGERQYLSRFEGYCTAIWTLTILDPRSSLAAWSPTWWSFRFPVFLSSPKYEKLQMSERLPDCPNCLIVGIWTDISGYFSSKSIFSLSLSAVLLHKATTRQKTNKKRITKTKKRSKPTPALQRLAW